jgi:hypothetical protein
MFRPPISLCLGRLDGAAESDIDIKLCERSRECFQLELSKGYLSALISVGFDF